MAGCHSTAGSIVGLLFCRDEAGELDPNVVNKFNRTKEHMKSLVPKLENSVFIKQFFYCSNKIKTLKRYCSILTKHLLPVTINLTKQKYMKIKESCLLHHVYMLPEMIACFFSFRQHTLI